MSYRFSFFLLFIFWGTVFFCMIMSCGSDDIVEDEIETASAILESATPSPDSDLATNSSITLTFNRNPGEVIASVGTISGSGKTRTITGPFPIGSLALTLEWSDSGDSRTLNYNVLPPPDTTAPTIVNSTIKVGDKAVDPSVINKAGSIKVHFNERVTGKISLKRSKDNVTVCWNSKVSFLGTSLMLMCDDLNYGTDYVIYGKVSDTAGNEAEVRIPFTTKDLTDGAPTITIVFKADDFNHHDPGIWAFQLHANELLKKDVFVAVEYTVVFNIDAHRFKHLMFAGGWNKWRVEGNSLIKRDLVFIPKHATFSKILLPPFAGIGREIKREHLKGMLIEILPWDRGWARHFGGNPFNFIGVIGGGWHLLNINVGQITPIYAVGNPSKAELWR